MQNTQQPAMRAKPAIPTDIKYKRLNVDIHVLNNKKVNIVALQGVGIRAVDYNQKGAYLSIPQDNCDNNLLYFNKFLSDGFMELILNFMRVQFIFQVKQSADLKETFKQVSGDIGIPACEFESIQSKYVQYSLCQFTELKVKPNKANPHSITSILKDYNLMCSFMQKCINDANVLFCKWASAQKQNTTTTENTAVIQKTSGVKQIKQNVNHLLSFKQQ